jgi:SAM-dependent methyltransferase
MSRVNRPSSAVNDPATVEREYATEDRFLARRLSAWAELHGPLVEDAMIDALAETAPTRVLEVGSGTGDLTERVQDELAVDLEVIDLSPRMVDLARARGLKACQGDVQALPFADGAFDCVLANRVLYHVPDLDEGLAEIERVLRPHGRLVAVTYSEHHLRELYDLVGDSPVAAMTFSAETGAAALGGHFDPVERHDIVGVARFRTVRSIAGMASQRFGSFGDVDLGARPGDMRTPFDASYRHALFVGHKRQPTA